jgi:hypothetical protein
LERGLHVLELRIEVVGIGGQGRVGVIFGWCLAHGMVRITCFSQAITALMKFFLKISVWNGHLRNLKKTNLEHRDTFFECCEAVLREKDICAPSKLREEQV